METQDLTKKTIAIIKKEFAICVCIALIITMFVFIAKLLKNPNIDVIEKRYGFMYALFFVFLIVCTMFLTKKLTLEFQQSIVYLVLLLLPNNIAGIIILNYQVNKFPIIAFFIGFAISLFLAWLFGRAYIIFEIISKQNIYECICVYLNTCIYVGSVSFDLTNNNFNYYVLIVSGSLIIANIINMYINSLKINKQDELLKLKKRFRLSTSIKERGQSFYDILSFPITYGTQEFPTSAHNIDCTNKLYDKFGNCNKKEMYAYWMRNHGQCFEQICKNKNIKLRNLCEMLFMLYDVITEDGVKKDSDINMRIDRDFNVQIEKLSVSSRELCDAMCSAAEEFLNKKEIEIIPWEKLICNGEETEDGVKINAITSKK